MMGRGSETLQSAWDARLEEGPDEPAVAFYSPSKGLKWDTRKRFDAKASGYGRMITDAGLRPGEVCLVVLPSGEEATLAVLGALLTGAVPLLIAPPTLLGANSHLADVLTDVAKRTEARVAVVPEDAEWAMDADMGSTRVVVPGQVDRATTGLERFFPEPSDVGALQLTSGTTGFPKICVWRQEGILAGIDGMTAAMGVTPDDVYFNWTPLYHDMGLVNNFLLALTRGIRLVMLSPLEFVRDPSLWLKGLSASGATVTWSPNFGFALAAARVTDRQMEDVDLSGVHAFWNAAERVHATTMERFRERFAPFGLREHSLKTNFGCAENVGGATFSDPDGPYRVEWVDMSRMFMERLAVPLAPETDGATPVVGVGRPYPGMELHILSPEGEPLDDGWVGEIALKTPSRMAAYLGNEEDTRRALHGDLLRTGDLGYKRGDELFWTGRAQERITIRGKKLDPSDLEPILFEIDGLRPGCFVAFGVDDEGLGTQKAIVISEIRESMTREADDLIRDVRRVTFESLGISLEEVVLVRPGTLTKTSSGKRRHRFFRDMYLKGGLDRDRVSTGEDST